MYIFTVVQILACNTYVHNYVIMNAAYECVIGIFRETEQKDDSDRGHDKEVLVRYYGDYKKEVLLKYRKTPAKPQINSLFKTGKPKIPPLHEERNQGKKLLQATHQDGTSVV